jgi:hypothetical protein
MKNVMLDLETLATTPDATILTIGAVPFCTETLKISEDVFYVKVELENQDRAISARTAAWWDEQTDEAKKEAFEGNRVSLDNALKAFSLWFSGVGSDVKIWGNGATFDVSIMEDAYRRDKTPWKFWNVRDMRTIVDFDRLNTDRPIFKGEKHSALADAKHQAEYVLAIWKTWNEFKREII